MSNVADQSDWWNPLLTSTTFTWLGGTATYITNDYIYHISETFGDHR